MRISAKRLLTPLGWAENQTVEICKGDVASIQPGLWGDRVCDVLVPGLVDLHNHGGGGFGVNEPTEDGLQMYLTQQAQSGVTDVLLGVSTDEKSSFIKAMAFARSAMLRQSLGEFPGARIRGIHMEGPFLSRKRPGAMEKEYMLPLTPALFEEIAGDAAQNVLLVTIAPEEEGAQELIKYLRNRGIAVQAGHTDATYEEAVHGFDWGVQSLCHTFNACRPIHHRDPGVVTAALLRKDVYCEMICDFEHLHPAIIQLIYQSKGPERVAIVSDSTRPQGLPDGEYALEGHTPVIVKNGVTRTATGALCGGGCYMGKAVKNLIGIGIPAADAFIMASETPARRVGLPNAGVIEVGKEAHLAAYTACFDPDFTVIGKQIIQRENR